LGLTSREWDRNSFAHANVSDRQPAWRISVSSDTRVAASPSTTNTVGLSRTAGGSLTPASVTALAMVIAFLRHRQHPRAWQSAHPPYLHAQAAVAHFALGRGVAWSSRSRSRSYDHPAWLTALECEDAVKPPAGRRSHPGAACDARWHAAAFERPASRSAARARD